MVREDLRDRELLVRKFDRGSCAGSPSAVRAIESHATSSAINGPCKRNIFLIHIVRPCCDARGPEAADDRPGFYVLAT